MRGPGIVAAMVLAAGWLAGCSAGEGDRAGADRTVRDLSLVEVPPVAAVQVSDLEAGRPLRGAGVSRKASDARRARAPVAETENEPVLAQTPPATIPAAAEPEAQATGLAGPAAAVDAAALEPPPEIVRAPMPAELPLGYAGPHLGEDYGSPGRRGPGIIIRGGRGGVDDDCDLHRPTLRRPGGIAINRLTPELPGTTVSGILGRPGGPSGGLRGRGR